MSLNLLLATLVCVMIVTLIANGIAMWWIIARRFDKIFPEYVQRKSALENGWWILSPYARGGRYAGCILFKNASKNNPYCRWLFNGYDFRANASRADWVVIITYLVQLSLFAILGLLVLLAHLHMV